MTEIIQQQTNTDLTHEEIARYSRHLILPDVGMEGQKKLKQAKVLIIGAGGLGSPLAMYLAAAGVGTLGLVDFDEVDKSNLQRQIIHTTDDIGRPKLQSAKDKINAMNPNVEVELHKTALDSSNALGIFDNYDIIVDCTDNFPTRYLTNDAAVFLNKPYVYGSIFRFEGQVTVFNADEDSPCYRCLYERPPPPGLVPSCAVGGVIGVLPGMIGTIQANEVIKLIIGKGEPLSGRLLLLDALDMEFKELKIRKNPDCVVCSDDPEITELIDYDQFCGVGEDVPIFSEDFSITVNELKGWQDSNKDFMILDVREEPETEISKIEGSTLIPKGAIADNLDKIPKDKPVVVHCKTGVRSAKVVNLLKQQGYDNVKNLIGGINGYAKNIDPSLPLY